MTEEYMTRSEIRPGSLDGISDDQVAQHWALYEGYVKNVNLLDEKIEKLSKNADYGAEFAELKRRQGFEYNGMILHEHYFGILKAGQAPLNKGSELLKRLDACFGGFAAWKKQFAAMGHMRGTGWVILYHDPARDLLTNVWITSHEEGHPSGFAPILVLDVWEHAYMVDWGAAGRPEYIEKFFLNVDWVKVDGAFRASCQTVPSRATR
jgi:Fe-Mn family superoxide dismutase